MNDVVDDCIDAVVTTPRMQDDCKAATAPGSLAAFPPSMEVRPGGTPRWMQDDCMDAGGRATQGAVAEVESRLEQRSRTATVGVLEVTALIPHSGSMVLLDRIIGCDDQGLTAELVVRGDGLLGDDKAVPAWAGIEYMAQTVAAYAGVMARQANEPIRLGFLLGTRHYSSNVAAFKVGATLTIRVKKIIQDDNLGVFDCLILGEGVNVAANLNVYQPPLDNR